MSREVHWSHLSMLWRCGEQYRRRYIEGEKIPPGVALIVGAGTHKSIDANLSHKLAAGELLPLEAVQQAARDYVAHQFEAGAYWLDPQERKENRGKDALRDGCVDSAVALSTCHHAQLAPAILPVAVERQWSLEVQGYPFTLAGTLDIQEAQAIRDTKTAGKTPPQSEADGSDQLTMYGMAVTVLDRRMPAQYCLDALVKTKKPKAVTRVTYRTAADFQVLLDRIAVSVRGIESGIFLPADRKQWWCAERFCGYAETCPYYHARTVHQAVKGAENG